MSGNIFSKLGKYLTCQKGFSLMELIITFSVIGIMLAFATINFSDWQKKYQIERQTREMFTDINDARVRAVYTKKRYSVVFEPGSLVMKNYSTGNEAQAAGTVLSTKTLSYQLTKSDGAVDGDHIVFDSRGFIENDEDDEDDAGLTVVINPINTGAAYDCIVLSTGRTNMGKMQNGQCVY